MAIEYDIENGSTAAALALLSADYPEPATPRVWSVGF